MQNCPYCATTIAPQKPMFGYGASEEMRAARAMSEHKARCPQKRFLGGALTIEGGQQALERLLGLEG